MQNRDEGSPAASTFDNGLNIALVALVGVTPLVFYRGGTNAFQLPKVTFVVVASILLLGCLAFRALVGRGLNLRWSPVLMPIAAIVISGLSATSLATSPARSLLGASSHYAGLWLYLALAIVVLTMLSASNERSLWWLVDAFLAAGSAVGVYGLAQSVGLDPLKWNAPVGPVFATLGNPNFLSGYLAVVAVLALGAALAPTRGRRQRIFAGLTCAIGLVTVFRTHSFQGLPAVGLGSIVVLLVHREQVVNAVRGHRPTDRRVWAALGVGMILAVALVGPRLIRFGVSGVQHGLHERAPYWHVAARLIAKHPTVGSGLDSFGEHYFRYRPAGETSFELAEDPHSVPLAMFLGGGIPLGIAYLGFVGTTAFVLVRGLRKGDADGRLLLSVLGGGWLAYQAQSLVSIDTPAVALSHWVLVGAIAAVSAAQGTAPLSSSRTSAVAGKRERGTRNKGRTVGRPAARRPLSVSTAAGVAIVSILGLVLSWSALRPLRADVAAANADARLRTHRAPAAVGRARQAARLAPWDGRYWYLLAVASELSGDRGGARAAGVRAAEEAPGSAQYAELAARFAEKENDLVAAARWYAIALRRNPNDKALADRATRLRATRVGPGS